MFKNLDHEVTQFSILLSEPYNSSISTGIGQENYENYATQELVVALYYILQYNIK